MLMKCSRAIKPIRKHMLCFCSTSYEYNTIIYQTSNRKQSTSVSAAANSDGESSFYESLNSPKHILAPMVAQSDLPFRLMCEQLYNVDLSYTQMIHAYNFVEPNGEIFRTNHLDVYDQSTVRDVLLGKEDSSALMNTPSQSNAIKGLSDFDIEQSRKRILTAIAKKTGSNIDGDILPIKKTIVQIAGHNPDIAVRAANMILERAGDALVAGKCAFAVLDTRHYLTAFSPHFTNISYYLLSFTHIFQGLI